MDCAPEALISAYLAGDCTIEEREIVMTWASASPRNAQDLATATMIWQNAGTVPPLDPSPFLQQLQATMMAEGNSTIRPDETRWQEGTPFVVGKGRRGFLPRLSRLGQNGVSLALGFVGIVCLGIAGLTVQHNISAKQQVHVSYVTRPGQRATLTLPHGSAVTLNVATRLQFALSDRSRTADLVGEAMFVETHNERVPLSVHAGPSVTRVLGTRFFVRHYPTDTVATVAVQDGKVSSNEVVVGAGEQVVIDQDGTVRQRTPYRAALTFMNGFLTITDMRFADAVVELDRWYNADIRFGDPTLKDRKIRGGFSAGSLEDLTELLEWTFDLRVVRSGRVLTLYSK